MNKTGRIVTTIALVIITVFMAVPFLWAVLLSFRTNAELFSNPLSLPISWNFDNYNRAMQTLNLPRLYFNTIYVLFFSIGISLVITFMSSYAISRMVFRSKRFKDAIYTYLILGLMIPPFILLFPIYWIGVTLGIHMTRWPLILAYIATNVSFNTLVLTNFFRSIPVEMEEAALMDGCELFRLCVQIIVPIAKPAITTVFIFNTLYVWNEFPFASILLPTQDMFTLSLGASFFRGLYTVDMTGIIASSLLIIIPQLVFYGIFQRNIVEGMTAGAVKG